LIGFKKKHFMFYTKSKYFSLNKNLNLAYMKKMINLIYRTLIKFFPISIYSIKHIIRWIIWQEYRRYNSIISPSSVFYLRHRGKVIIFLYPLLYLVKKYCQKNQMYISVNNIPFAVGHLYPEIDHLLRVLMSDKKYQKAIFLYVYPKNKMLYEASRIFKRKNFKIIQSGLLHMICYFAAINFKEIRIDCSNSGHAHHKSSGLEEHRYLFENKFSEFAKIYNATSKEYPLLKFGNENPIPGELIDFIGSRKYVVIQIKDYAANATWKAVDPSTYEASIIRLKDMGYKVVFAGREKMPNNFKILGVINYSESEFATALNDYFLVFNSDLVIASASGFSLMGDLLDKPLLLLNIWQLSNCVGRRTVFLPTVITKNNTKLKFKEQYKFFIDQNGVNSKGLSEEQKYIYNAVDASEEDIEFALLELLNNVFDDTILKRSTLQLDYNSLFPETWTSNGLSRISQKFLEKNIELMTNE